MHKVDIKDVLMVNKKEGVKIMKKSYLFAGTVALLAVIAGCHFYGQKSEMGGMPAVNVTVAEVQEEKINNPKTYVALVEAINSVDVVAKVSGSLDKVNFVEGSFVKKDDPQALYMKTIVEPMQWNNDFTLLQVKIVTGRMHQIRIHLSGISHPVIGDRKYGDFQLNRQLKQKFGLNHQLLHAYKICFKDPFGSLSYLKGKEIICNVPKQFGQIEKSLFESVF